MPERFTLSPRTFLCPRMRMPVIDGEFSEAKWSGASRSTDFMSRLRDGQPARLKTSLWMGHDDGYLYLAVRCDEKNTQALRRHCTPNNARGGMGMGDRITICFDTSHNHVAFRSFTFGPFDQMEVFEGSYTVGFRDGPDSRWISIQGSLTEKNYCRSAARVEEGAFWSVEIAIPFESLGTKPPSRGMVWGFNLSRYSIWPVSTEGNQDPRSTGDVLSAWPGFRHRSPACYADMVFDDDQALKLSVLDLEVPHYGENRSPIRFSAPRESMPMTVIGRVRSRANGALINPGLETALQSTVDGFLEAEMVWTPFLSDDTNVLDIEVKRASDGKTEWRGSYDLGWETGSLPIYYLHQGESRSVPCDPDPGDPDFLRKKAEFIAGRQPRFRRINTSQGAPSDFTLESSDGLARFNLMEKGVTDAMARYIHTLYENDADRLVGMMFFMGQSCMMRSNSIYDPAATARLNPLSMLRLGSGHCAHHSYVMAPFINRMEMGHTGKYHKARLAMIGGHCLVVVEYRGDYAVLDAKHCCMFYTLDNKDIATLAEIRREPEIVRRAYPHWILPALMTFDEQYVADASPDSFFTDGYSYPSGAPLA